jgi:hypothetical protein
MIIDIINRLGSTYPKLESEAITIILGEPISLTADESVELRTFTHQYWKKIGSKRKYHYRITSARNLERTADEGDIAEKKRFDHLRIAANDYENAAKDAHSLNWFGAEARCRIHAYELYSDIQEFFKRVGGRRLTEVQQALEWNFEYLCSLDENQLESAGYSFTRKSFE